MYSRSVIEQLHENGYLHRDISIGNIILADGDEDLTDSKDRDSLTKRLEGYLIDYDHAIKIADEPTSTLTDKTVRDRSPSAVDSDLMEKHQGYIAIHGHRTS